MNCNINKEIKKRLFISRKNINLFFAHIFLFEIVIPSEIRILHETFVKKETYLQCSSSAVKCQNDIEVMMFTFVVHCILSAQLICLCAPVVKGQQLLLLINNNFILFSGVVKHYSFSVNGFYY